MLQVDFFQDVHTLSLKKQKQKPKNNLLISSFYLNPHPLSSSNLSSLKNIFKSSLQTPTTEP